MDDINRLTPLKKQLYLSFILAYQDIKLRYRRSIIGPFWSTISMGVVITSVGFVFGSIFRSPMEEYLPFLAVGLIVWTFILGTISEGCNVFIDSEHMIKQLNLPFSIFVFTSSCLSFERAGGLPGVPPKKWSTF